MILLQVALSTVLAALNHFPLFAIMLHWKDPCRLPGGVSFEPCPPNFLAKRARRSWRDRWRRDTDSADEWLESQPASGAKQSYVYMKVSDEVSSAKNVDG